MRCEFDEVKMMANHNISWNSLTGWYLGALNFLRWNPSDMVFDRQIATSRTVPPQFAGSVSQPTLASPGHPPGTLEIQRFLAHCILQQILDALAIWEANFCLHSRLNQFDNWISINIEYHVAASDLSESVYICFCFTFWSFPARFWLRSLWYQRVRGFPASALSTFFKNSDRSLAEMVPSFENPMANRHNRFNRCHFSRGPILESCMTMALPLSSSCICMDLLLELIELFKRHDSNEKLLWNVWIIHVESCRPWILRYRVVSG